MSEEATPTFAQVLRAAAGNRVKEMFGGWLPGRVVSYDESKRKASIEICIDDVYFEEGEREHEPYPIINEVPIQFPGSGGVRITFPIAVGDFVTVLFASRSVDRWLQLGGAGVDPGDDRDHDMNDAVAMPGLLPFNAVSNAAAMIEFKASTVEIGGSEPLVKRSEFLAHTHATAGTGTPSPPISGTPGSAATFPGTGVLRG